MSIRFAPATVHLDQCPHHGIYVCLEPGGPPMLVGEPLVRINLVEPDDVPRYYMRDEGRRNVILHSLRKAVEMGVI
ncbi:MAG TPA: hypothetical protein PKE55_11380 [Kiritimatiellia bacterium]|nr:hypothetical protein [Kiritimatiellia bacterium]